MGRGKFADSVSGKLESEETSAKCKPLSKYRILGMFPLLQHFTNHVRKSQASCCCAVVLRILSSFLALSPRQTLDTPERQTRSSLCDIRKVTLSGRGRGLLITDTGLPVGPAGNQTKIFHTTDVCSFHNWRFTLSSFR